MISYIKGVLAEKSPARAVIEACGVGYEFFISLFTYESLPRTGQDVKLFASHIVREDGQFLYGFASEAEREMFTKLTSVSGVGPKVALSILSGLTLTDLAVSISSSDAKRISSIKGVGKKTAEKICIELKDKVSAFESYLKAGDVSTIKEFVKDAIMALSALGFNEESAAKAISSILASDPSISNAEVLIKKVLATSSRA
jgi:Holliday junction DNA helicase RuvA